MSTLDLEMLKEWIPGEYYLLLIIMGTKITIEYWHKYYDNRTGCIMGAKGRPHNIIN